MKEYNNQVKKRNKEISKFSLVILPFWVLSYLTMKHKLSPFFFLDSMHKANKALKLTISSHSDNIIIIFNL